MRQIGLIGGIGPAATEFYYRGLLRAAANDGVSADLTIVNADVSTLVANLNAGQAEAQADIFVPLLARLKAAGAAFGAITSMGGHFCAPEVAARTPLPLVDGIQALDAEFVRRGVTRAGLLGASAVTSSGLYGRIASAEVVAPAGEDLGAVGEAYLAMATAGQVTEAQRAVFFDAGRRMMDEQGADAIVLGGTDLCLAFEGVDPGFPVIDAAEVHIAALYAAARTR